MSESTPAERPDPAQPEGRTATTAAADTGKPPTWRVAPSVPVAVGVFLAYVVAFIGLSATSGIAYDDWFVSGPNILRAAVIPLIGGSVVLIAFLLWARWDFVFADPERLPMTRALRVILALYALCIVAQFAVADWGAGMDRLLPIVAAGILVGFAEETLFRGIILRSLRTNLRPEAAVVLITAVWFGVFHLTNVLNGGNVISVVIQVFLASASGIVLYLFRRFRGQLVLAMLIHGLWDTSLFLPGPGGALANVSRVTMLIAIGCAVVVLIVTLRHDRSFTVTRSGIRKL